MIDNEFWCWSIIHIIPQQLKEFPIATKNNKVAILSSNYTSIFIEIINKNYKYEVFSNKRYCRTIWELECQKSKLINDGFKINWDNYQSILQMYNERFKKYSPYIP